MKAVLGGQPSRIAATTYCAAGGCATDAGPADRRRHLKLRETMLPASMHRQHSSAVLRKSASRRPGGGMRVVPRSSGRNLERILDQNCAQLHAHPVPPVVSTE